jgi:hypothetical protein
VGVADGRHDEAVADVGGDGARRGLTDRQGEVAAPTVGTRGEGFPRRADTNWWSWRQRVPNRTAPRTTVGFTKG